MPDNTLMRLIDAAVVLVLAVVVSKPRQNVALENRRREQIEMRDQAARRHFNRPYEELTEIQKKAINDVVPQAISEALPRSTV